MFPPSRMNAVKSLSCMNALSKSSFMDRYGDKVEGMVFNKGNKEEEVDNRVELARLMAAEREKSEKYHNETRERNPRLPAEQSAVYREALNVLNKSGIPYAVGAAFARHVYTSIWRNTKDLDVFLRHDDLRAVMDTLESAGFKTEIKDRSWLAKAWKDGHFLDLIFGNGHGQFPIDDRSFEGVKIGKVLGIAAPLIPMEEMIASAAYVAGRNRFDGPEVAHLIRSAKGKLNWQRILERMGENRELLLWHLIHFDFLYPGHSNYLPQDLMVELFEEARSRWANQKQKRGLKHTKMFRGTLLDPFSYTVDVEDWGYEDRRNKDPLVDRKGNRLSEA